MGDLTDSNTNAFPYGLGDRMGMTLRDWFAGQALASAYCASTSLKATVESAYRVADAMLAERTKK